MTIGWAIKSQDTWNLIISLFSQLRIEKTNLFLFVIFAIKPSFRAHNVSFWCYEFGLINQHSLHCYRETAIQNESAARHPVNVIWNEEWLKRARNIIYSYDDCNSSWLLTLLEVQITISSILHYAVVTLCMDKHISHNLTQI